MEKGTVFFAIIAAIAVIGLVIVAGMKAAAPINIQPAPERNMLTVTGTKEFFVTPDEAQISLRVITRAPQAKTASDLNKARLTAIMAALKNQGIAQEDIATTGVVLQKVTEWDKQKEQSVDKGYEQITTMRVTVKDLSKVGDALDAAINAGANSVQDIQFTLRPETEAAYKRDALRNATSIAREKSELMADAAGTSLGAVSGISENSYITPWVTSNVADYASGMANGQTPISPERVSLKASVSVTYKLE
jgi:uncharacterized protein YggE